MKVARQRHGRGVAASDRGAAAPDRGVTAPDRGVAAPDRGVAAPDRGAAAPDHGVAAPDRGAAAPDRDAAVRPIQDKTVNVRELKEFGAKGPAWRCLDTDTRDPKPENAAPTS